MIWQAFIEGLNLALSGEALAFLALGVALGLVVGILPGLGGTTTIVLVLPFLFHMDPVPAFSLLLGLASTTNTSGDVTSVLFGVPGEATAAATVIDGYALTQKGEGGRAVGAALFGSMVGALVGALALFAAIPIVRPLVLSLFSSEFFMLALVGVAAIAGISGAAPMRGVLSGCVGLLLAFVGLDAATGLGRMTFGSQYLWLGIPLEAMALGLFAVPSIVDMAIRPPEPRYAMPNSQELRSGVWQGVTDVVHHWRITLSGSLIGTGIGILPGLGGSVAQWMSYSAAVALGKDKTRFGKGAIEGVIGPGSANNSKDGASLIPTIAFGIPGSVTMAFILGAFTLTGLVPGTAMLTTNLSITLSFVWMIIIANLVAVPLLLLLTPQLVKLTFVPPSTLVPLILGLVFVAAYTARSTMLDVATMVVFGVFGYLMVLGRWPRAPLMIGFILGPIMENHLRTAYGYYGFDWITRPGVIILALIAIFMIASGTRITNRLRVKSKQSIPE